MNRLAGGTNRTLLISVYPLVFAISVLAVVVFQWAVTPISVLSAPFIRFPSAAHSDPFPETEDQVAVTLTAAGETFLDRRRVSLPELVSFAAHLVASRPRRPFLVRVDARLSFGQVRVLIAALRQGGANHFRLVTQD